jgi:uncharacterized protein (TIGR02466 family)
MQENRHFNVIKTTSLPMWIWENNNPIPNLDIDYWIEKCYIISREYPSVSKSNSKEGYQSPQHVVGIDAFAPLVDILRNQVSIFLEHNNFKMDALWVNISGHGCYNSMHHHGFDSSLISGVLYLQTPENCGDIGFYNKYDDQRGVNVEPLPGKLLLFPQCLQHYVYPNLSDKDRISIAFNCM